MRTRELPPDIKKNIRDVEAKRAAGIASEPEWNAEIERKKAMERGRKSLEGFSHTPPKREVRISSRARIGASGTHSRQERSGFFDKKLDRPSEPTRIHPDEKHMRPAA